MRYEVRTEKGLVMAVFSTEMLAREFAESKGWKVVNINPDYCPSYTSWRKCNFAGLDEVEIGETHYYKKSRF